MFNVVEQALGEIVRVGWALMVPRTQMCYIVRTKSVADTIIQAALYETGFIVQIEEMVGKVVGSAVNKCRLHDLEDASVKTSGIYLSIKPPPSVWEGDKRWRLILSCKRKTFIAVAAVPRLAEAVTRNWYQIEVI